MTTNVDTTMRAIEHQLNLEPGTIQPGGDLVKDYGADSLDIVCLLYTSPSPRD